MNKPVRILLYYLALVILFTNCRDEAMEEYYTRPETLADPIYQQLESSGNFKNYLALVDKANYKKTLSGAGYWTVFAPNDQAFAQFFQQSEFSDIDAIDQETAEKIVRYSLIYNAFTMERLSDYQANLGWIEDAAFKRKTAYYSGVYTADQITVDGQLLNQQKVISSNRHAGAFNPEDNNNKYIPYFIQDYFADQQLSAADYNYFYPNTNWTGFNVVGAKVVRENVFAENGYIHEIDKVIPPLENLETYLASKPEYSEFRSLYEKYMVSYTKNLDATTKYQVRTGSSDPVYVKLYNPELTFSLNNENYEQIGVSNDDNAGQTDGYSLFAPTNNELTSYINNVLLEHYESLDKMPRHIIRDFLNAHMFPTTVWPTKFSSTSNDFGEEARFDAASDVVDAKILSNGFFYGTNKVQKANVFHTVYGKAYLNPEYSMMIRALEGDLKFTVSNPAVPLTMFLISNEALTNAGFSWDDQFLRWVYTPPAGGATLVGGQAQVRLQRIINQHIAFTFSDELADLSGEGVVETFGGEYIRYENGNVYAAGNADAGEVVNVTGPVETMNGIVYYTDRILNFSEKKISQHIGENPEFSHFYNYLVNSPLMYDASTLDIKGTSTGTPYTLFIPTNAAIEQAVNDGLLPGTAGAPNFNPGSASERDQVAKFIKYHIIANENIVTDGKKDGGFETLFTNLEGEKGMLSITNEPGAIQITDDNGRIVNVVKENSNILSNRAILHQVDNYLQYFEN